MLAAMLNGSIFRVKGNGRPAKLGALDLQAYSLFVSFQPQGLATYGWHVSEPSLLAANKIVVVPRFARTKLKNTVGEDMDRVILNIVPATVVSGKYFIVYIDQTCRCSLNFLHYHNWIGHFKTGKAVFGYVSLRPIR